MEYHRQGLDTEILHCFGIDDAPEPDLSRWQQISDTIHNPDGEVTIGVVGKYVGLLDAYKSLIEALNHAASPMGVKVRLKWLDSEQFEKDDPFEPLEDVHGVLVPGGFGERGVEGKIAAAKFARERKVPFFGICYGMQMAVLEAARNLAGVPDAVSSEFSSEGEPVVGLLTEWTRGNESRPARPRAIWVVRCVWAPIRPFSRKAAACARSMAPPISRNATGTAMR